MSFYILFIYRFCTALITIVFIIYFRTSDGGVFWEGLEKEVTGVDITSWLGEAHWTKSSGKPAAHPNSR
jgi:phosphoenolpyruvate carboxykinase (GTP)